MDEERGDLVKSILRKKERKRTRGGYRFVFIVTKKKKEMKNFNRFFDLTRWKQKRFERVL